MNQKGEAILFFVLVLVLISGLLTLCGLELQHSFSLLQKRTSLFTCVKETKGEIHRYLKFMGRTNWALKNTSSAQLITVFIPGLQGAALSAEKVKKAIKQLQTGALLNYYVQLQRLKIKGCPLDPRMLQSPFTIKAMKYQRDTSERTILRSSSWTYLYSSGPYLLTLKINAEKYNAMNPQIYFEAREKVARLSFPLFFH
jgi:hypothetical protein